MSQTKYLEGPGRLRSPRPNVEYGELRTYVLSEKGGREEFINSRQLLTKGNTGPVSSNYSRKAGILEF